MRRDVHALAGRDFDIVVVGGGIHGAWIALRAARAGYRTALIEKGDFGAATSTNNLKILHGGLRYLQHLDWRRMRGAIRARREFAQLSPHLVRPLPCVLPLGSTGVRSPWILAPALIANDLVSWDRNSGLNGAQRLPRGRIVGARRCRALLAPLTNLSPVAGVIWWDAAALDTGGIGISNGSFLEHQELGGPTAAALEEMPFAQRQPQQGPVYDESCALCRNRKKVSRETSPVRQIDRLLESQPVQSQERAPHDTKCPPCA